MEEKDSLLLFFKNTEKALKTHTIHDLNAAVCDFLKNKNERLDHVEIVLDEVANAYGISKRTLTKSTARGKIQIAKKMCYCLLHRELNLNTRFIANKIFKKWQNSISVAIQYYKNLDPKLKQDKEFIDMYAILQVKILNKIKPVKTIN